MEANDWLESPPKCPIKGVKSIARGALRVQIKSLRVEGYKGLLITHYIVHFSGNLVPPTFLEDSIK